MEIKRHEAEHENEERWLLTYADLITLLMAFFMVLWAMSQVDTKKYQHLSRSLKMAFQSPLMSPTRSPYSNPPSQLVKPSIAKEDVGARRARAQELKRALEEIVRQEGLQEDVFIFIGDDDRSVVVRLSAILLFQPGSAELVPRAQPLIAQFASVLRKAGKPLRVEGHTDNIPIRTAQFKSNWQLSAARAANTLLYLQTEYGLEPQLLSASGYGEYRPIAENDSPEGRSRNRRVEFVISLANEET